MTPLRFPPPLRRGDTIAVTAPSSGVEPACHARLDLVVQHLHGRGFHVVEGDCLRREFKNASAPAAERAAELTRFLQDPTVAAIIPPWGGELACELLPLIDFDALRGIEPKWLLGYSDTSTLLLPLTLISGWATAHGPCLMDMVPAQTDALTTGALPALMHHWQLPLRQLSSLLHQTRWTDFEREPSAALRLDTPTCWRRLDGLDAPLDLTGHLIGGCIDTLVWLAGSRYGSVPTSGCSLLYLENAEMSPLALVRAFGLMRRSGWFGGLSGLLVGRSAGPRPSDARALSYDDALHAALDGLPFPVLIDVDIGHVPPQFTLVNGAATQVHFEKSGGWIEQHSSG